MVAETGVIEFQGFRENLISTLILDGFLHEKSIKTQRNANQPTSCSTSNISDTSLICELNRKFVNID